MKSQSSEIFVDAAGTRWRFRHDGAVGWMEFSETGAVDWTTVDRSKICAKLHERNIFLEAALSESVERLLEYKPVTVGKAELADYCDSLLKENPELAPCLQRDWEAKPHICNSCFLVAKHWRPGGAWPEALVEQIERMEQALEQALHLGGIELVDMETGNAIVHNSPAVIQTPLLGPEKDYPELVAILEAKHHRLG